jgi:hypothetical protein
MHVFTPHACVPTQDCKARLFILEQINPSGSRVGTAYSLKSHPQFGSAAAYFDTVHGWGPCFGTALRPNDNGYGLTFLSPPVTGGGADLRLKANRHLARSAGIDCLLDLTSDDADRTGIWGALRTKELRIYAVQQAAGGSSLACPKLGTAPAGVTFVTEVRHY